MGQGRRFLRLGVLGLLGAIVAVWFQRRRLPEAVGPGVAEWPPLVVDEAHRPVVQEPRDGGAAEPAAPTDGPDPASAGAWVGAATDGSCPLSHPIKAKVSSGIYHQPDGLAYERTNADRCYASPAAAEADGFRAAKL